MSERDIENQMAGIKWAMENAHVIQILKEPNSSKIPDFVRKAWINMILPALPADKIAEISNNIKNKTGYFVPAREAIKRLSRKNLEAANW